MELKSRKIFLVLGVASVGVLMVVVSVIAMIYLFRSTATNATNRIVSYEATKNLLSLMRLDSNADDVEVGWFKSTGTSDAIAVESANTRRWKALVSLLHHADPTLYTNMSEIFLAKTRYETDSTKRNAFETRLKDAMDAAETAVGPSALDAESKIERHLAFAKFLAAESQGTNNKFEITKEYEKICRKPTNKAFLEYAETHTSNGMVLNALIKAFRLRPLSSNDFEFSGWMEYQLSRYGMLHTMVLFGTKLTHEIKNVMLCYEDLPTKVASVVDKANFLKYGNEKGCMTFTDFTQTRYVREMVLNTVGLRLIDNFGTLETVTLGDFARIFPEGKDLVLANHAESEMLDGVFDEVSGEILKAYTGTYEPDLKLGHYRNIGGSNINM